MIKVLNYLLAPFGKIRFLKRILRDKTIYIYVVCGLRKKVQFHFWGKN